MKRLIVLVLICISIINLSGCSKSKSEFFITVNSEKVNYVKLSEDDHKDNKNLFKFAFEDDENIIYCKYGQKVYINFDKELPEYVVAEDVILNEKGDLLSPESEIIESPVIEDEKGYFILISQDRYFENATDNKIQYRGYKLKAYWEESGKTEYYAIVLKTDTRLGIEEKMRDVGIQIKEIESSEKNPIASVGDIIIYNDSVERFKLNSSLTANTPSEEEMLDKMIINELLFQKAKELGLLASEEEVEEKIKITREALGEENFMEPYLEGLGLTTEEYLEVVRDSILRSLSIGNLKRQITNKAIDKEKKWDNYIKELKEEAIIKYY